MTTKLPAPHSAAKLELALDALASKTPSSGRMIFALDRDNVTFGDMG